WRAAARRRRPGGLGAERHPDRLRRAGRPLRTGPRRGNGVLRRSFRTAAGLAASFRNEEGAARPSRATPDIRCACQLAARRLTLLSARAVSFWSVAFSSSSVLA